MKVGQPKLRLDVPHQLQHVGGAWPKLRPDVPQQLHHLCVEETCRARVRPLGEAREVAELGVFPLGEEEWTFEPDERELADEAHRPVPEGRHQACPQGKGIVSQG